jgi:hypothetical protein
MTKHVLKTDNNVIVRTKCNRSTYFNFAKNISRFELLSISLNIFGDFRNLLDNAMHVSMSILAF